MESLGNRVIERGIGCHFTGASSELYSVFSKGSKSYKYLTKHTFEEFVEKINGYA